MKNADTENLACHETLAASHQLLRPSFFDSCSMVLRHRGGGQDGPIMRYLEYNNGDTMKTGVARRGGFTRVKQGQTLAKLVLYHFYHLADFFHITAKTTCVKNRAKQTFGWGNVNLWESDAFWLSSKQVAGIETRGVASLAQEGRKFPSPSQTRSHVRSDVIRLLCA